MDKKAFTLVELIVVITILSILGTIAFLSYNSYMSKSRDSVRLSDIKNITKVLNIHKTVNGFYPIVTDGQNITYSGATVWTQGFFGEETRKQLGAEGNISIIPVDPLTKNRYSYSITKDKLEYQIGAALEGDNNEEALIILGNKTYASKSTLNTYLEGDYNGKIVKTSSGGVDYIITTPTIIASNLSNLDILDIIEGKKLSFNKYLNLPASYSGVINNVSTGSTFDFSGGNNLVFKGDFMELYSDKMMKMELYENIAKRYNNSILRGKGEYKIFSDAFNDRLNPTKQYIDFTCYVVADLLKDENNKSCNEEKEDILKGEAYTGALLPNGETNYIGQWPLGDPYNYGQGLQTANHERSTLGMYGGLNKTLGVKWKLFTRNKNAINYFGGVDINGDGNENILYGFGGKLVVGDTVTKKVKWQTKVLDIKKVLGVEDIMGDGSKSIIVSLGEDRYIGVINGKNGNLDWISDKVSGTVKKVKPGWPGLNYKVFDIDGDGIKEYHFKQRYHKYHSMKFFKSGDKVIGETLWSSEGYGNYNENVSDGYQPYVWSMGTINNKLIVGTKGSNTFSFYANNIDSSLSAPDKFKMPAFAKLNVGGDSGHGRSRSISYFYDIDGDGNDEHIARIDKELNNSKNTRIIVSGLDSAGEIKQYMSLASSSGANNFSKPIALKNYSNLNDSYILTKGEDPVDGVEKWMMLKYNGSNSSAYKKDSGLNESFNYSIVYDKLDSSYTPIGIFGNGQKDYVVLRKGSYYYFYTFNGVDTFSSESPLKIYGSFFGNTLFDNGYDLRREKNKDSGVFLAGFDIDGNGLNEFFIADGEYFKSYEITDSGVTLKKTYGKYNSIPRRVKYGMTSDNQNMYVISYDSTNNTIEYYRTNSDTGDYSFTKKTDKNFYSGGETADMVISKLGQGSDKYNRLMIKYKGMYDARNANPTNPPVKISNEFFYSYDMDRDGENEVFISGKAYTYNGPNNYSLKYNNTGWQGDIDGDGVLDRSWGYCASSANYPINLFYTIRSGKDNSEIIPTFDWGNGNGWCSGGNQYSGVSEDFNGDGKDDFVIGTAARAARVVSLSGSTSSGFTIKEGDLLPRIGGNYNLQAFDFDGDGIKEIIRGHDDELRVYKIDNIDKTKLNLLFSITRSMKSSWGKDLGLPSIIKDKDGKVYMAFNGVDGEITLYSWSSSEGLKKLFKKYYLYIKGYNSETSILNDGFVPIANADVILGDFMHEGSIQVLVGGGDGFVYIIGLDGELKRAFYIGSAIKRMIVGDTNNDLLIDIIVGAEDGYVYQISSARLDPPSFVGDGLSGDYNLQDGDQKVVVNFKSVDNSQGYYIQLYNYSRKEAVFDFIDIGNNLNKCIVPNNFVGDIGNCMKISKNYTLQKNIIYIWRVQAYNSDISSPIATSNGFIIK